MYYKSSQTKIKIPENNIFSYFCKPISCQMDIITIFTPVQNPDQELGLLSIQYDGEEQCEFDKLFENWQSPTYMAEFCQQNLVDIYVKFGCAINAEDALLQHLF